MHTDQGVYSTCLFRLHGVGVLSVNTYTMSMQYFIILGMVVHMQAVDTRLLSLLPHGLGARLMYLWRDNCGLLCCTSTSASESSAHRELPSAGLLM